MSNYLPAPALCCHLVKGVFESTLGLPELVLTLLQFRINRAFREILLKHKPDCVAQISSVTYSKQKAMSSECLYRPRNLGLCLLPDLLLLLSTLLTVFPTHWHPFCSLNTLGTFLPPSLSIWHFPLLVIFIPQICTLLPSRATLNSLINFTFPIKPSFIT